MSISIKVPATSANLGVGFDCLGIAFQLYNTFTFDFSDKLMINGKVEHPNKSRNLIFTSYKKALDFLKISYRPISIEVDTQVPVSRGLGSSATCVVAGIMAAYKLNKIEINKEDMLMLASQIEGHPDNVAPAIYGNLMLCTSLENEIIHTQLKMHESYHYLLFIPNYETSTEVMRSVLPDSYSRSDAVHNMSCIAQAVLAFQNGDDKVLKQVLDDKIHEPYRKEHLKEFKEIEKLCDDGIKLLISGSGSTLLCIHKGNLNIEEIKPLLKPLKYDWKVLEVKIDTLGATLC